MLRRSRYMYNPGRCNPGRCSFFEALGECGGDGPAAEVGRELAAEVLQQQPIHKSNMGTWALEHLAFGCVASIGKCLPVEYQWSRIY